HHERLERRGERGEPAEEEQHPDDGMEPLPSVEHRNLHELGDPREDQPERDEIADERDRVVVRLEHEEPDQDPEDPGDEEEPPPLAGGGFAHVGDPDCGHWYLRSPSATLTCRGASPSAR